MTHITTVSSGVVSSGLTLSGGDFLNILSGGEALSTIVSHGGGERIAGGGTASGTVVLFGGEETVRGTASGTVLSGGEAFVRRGGVAVGAVVSEGGILRVLSGGVAARTVVLSGGFETIREGGTAVGTVLSAGHEYDIGTAMRTRVRSGGIEYVLSGGVASNTAIGDGGTEYVASGAMAVAPTVFAGGRLKVVSGGVISGGLSLKHGLAVISGTMDAGQLVKFTGVAGVLKLDNLAGFNAKIVGLNVAAEKIDLGGFDFNSFETVSWAQSGTSGTLTVNDGRKAPAHLTLIGAYVTSDFVLARDGHGGTFVFDQTTATPKATRFVATMAGLRGGRAGASIHAASPSSLSAPPLVTAATTSGR